MQSDRVFVVYLFISILVIGVALAMWGLTVTHRISGPLYVIRRYLGALADGYYPEVRPLRKKDELTEFFSSFESALSAMKSRDVETLRDLDEALATARRGMEGDSGDALAASVETMERYRERILRSFGGQPGG